MFDPHDFLLVPSPITVTPAAKFVVNSTTPDVLEDVWQLHLRKLNASIKFLCSTNTALIVSDAGGWLRVVDTILPTGERLYTVCVDTELPRIKGQYIAAALKAAGWI